VRKFIVIDAERFEFEIKKQIRDPDVKRIIDHAEIGAVEQFSTSTDLLSDTIICIRLCGIYLLIGFLPPVNYFRYY
jgi:hypothetical protein